MSLYKFAAETPRLEMFEHLLLFIGLLHRAKNLSKWALVHMRKNMSLRFLRSLMKTLMLLQRSP